jgi:uncharacterized pyridoxamine 5'-phosphate oxidase family protein
MGLKKMNQKDCIRFANENPVCYLATMDGKQPRVRGMLFWFADETGFYMQSGKVKGLYKQLKENPKAEICFFKPDQKGGVMMRVTGEVEFLDDPKLKEKAVNDRQFLKAMGITAKDPGLLIFRIPKGVAYFWNMENNLKPKEYINFRR